VSNIERRISDLLAHEADKVPLPAGISVGLLRKAKIRRMLTAALAGLMAIAIIMTGLVTTKTFRTPPPSNIGPASGETPSSSSSSREVDGCPVTVPPDPAFVPPEPYPSRPPDLYDKEWYGTAELWTWLGSEGEVWQDLADDNGDGMLSEKTFWWSEELASGGRLTPITVAARRLDGPGSFRVTAPGGGGYRADIRSFMLVGVKIRAGCWELTARYRNAELSYVVLIKEA
jgi:hypothetical protein